LLERKSSLALFDVNKYKWAMTLRKTGQGGKVVLQIVFKERFWKNSFGHFSLYKFSNSFVKSKLILFTFIMEYI
jgi:hypothetical protein